MGRNARWAGWGIQDGFQLPSLPFSVFFVPRASSFLLKMRLCFKAVCGAVVRLPSLMTSTFHMRLPALKLCGSVYFVPAHRAQSWPYTTTRSAGVADFAQAGPGRLRADF